MCLKCNEIKSMGHILTQCTEWTMPMVWRFVKDLWPHRTIPWPEVTLGTILGCSSISLKSDRQGRNDQRQPHKKTYPGATWLFQILLSELAYLIWVLRCERVIQEQLLPKGHCNENQMIKPIHEPSRRNLGTSSKENHGPTSNLDAVSWGFSG